MLDKYIQYKVQSTQYTVYSIITHQVSSIKWQAIDRTFDLGSDEADSVKTLFNATNLIGTPLGDTDFMYAAAGGAPPPHPLALRC